mmetsp:Transcript_2865/g.3195  ORF Transcript_2865/g.3195 Transcript_2865/m.3195 type:complete len:195 (+) Transcript_2865:37-621(+)
MSQLISNSSVAVFGASGVGKTAITIRFVNNHFVIDYDPTIEDAYRKVLSVDSQVTLLDILDTAGQEAFSALQNMYVKSSKGFILVYSITEKETLRDLRKYVNRIIDELKRDDMPIVVVGNKCDLKKQRKVSSSAGRDFAKSIKASFFEASAKTGHNVEEVFSELVRNIRRSEELQQRKKGCKVRRRRRKKCKLV